MTLLTLPPDKRLVWYLAAEEYLGEHIADFGGKELLFAWQSRPTVIIGRHQSMEAEVNLPWCEAHGVEVYRRKSGGGCVYSDSGNLMLSMVSPNLHSQEAYERYMSLIVSLLRSLGLPAVSTAHNDVLVGEKKVSGTACFATPTATILHGTLLVESRLGDVEQAITPSEEKLRKHAVASVRQRVANLQDFRPELSMEEVRSALGRMAEIDHSLSLSEEALAPISLQEQTYLDPTFLFGKGA